MTTPPPKILIETQYLPSLAYFCTIKHASSIVLEGHEHFEKQTYRNRCYLNTAAGIEMLTIPLLHGPGKTPIREMKIDYAQKWLNQHWRTIRSAYGQAPFFEHYAPDLETILFRKSTFLYDLNVALLTMCLKWLQWDIPLVETMTYNKDSDPSHYDLRSAINPKRADLARFYSPVPYTQVFGNKFVPNLSLIDLIFCQGPEASRVLEQSRGTLNK